MIINDIPYAMGMPSDKSLAKPRHVSHVSSPGEAIDSAAVFAASDVGYTFFTSPR
jgi:hypothetical protein